MNSVSSLRTDLPGRFNELDVLRRNRERYRLSMQSQILPPYEAMIHPSSVCNLQCDWCIGENVPTFVNDEQLNSSKFSEQRLNDDIGSVENMTNLVEELVSYERRGTTLQGEEKTFGVETVNFSGLIGDPMTRKEAVFAAADILKNAGRRVGCFTNGTLINSDDVAPAARLSFLHVSLDAYEPETYASLKYQGRDAGRSLHGRAVTTIRQVASHAREHETGLQLAVGFVVYPQNFREILSAARLAKEAGAHVFKVKQDISCTQVLDFDQLNFVRDQLRRAREFEDDSFKLLEIHNPQTGPTRHRAFDACRITKLMASIGSDGGMYPCNYHPRVGGVSFGNVIRDGFVNCWEGAVRQSVLPQLPGLCPPTCDPFKGRANTLFAEIEARREIIGDTAMELEISEMVGGDTYDIRHPGEY